MLAACVAVEDGLLEAQCFVTLESDALPLQQLLNCLRLDSEAHRDTLAAALESVRPAD